MPRLSEFLGVRVVIITLWHPVSSCLTMSLRKWLYCTEIFGMMILMLEGTEREIRPLFVLNKTDVQYPVYLWTGMASKKEQGSWEYILSTWKGSSRSLRVYSQLLNHSFMYFLLQVFALSEAPLPPLPLAWPWYVFPFIKYVWLHSPLVFCLLACSAVWPTRVSNITQNAWGWWFLESKHCHRDLLLAQGQACQPLFSLWSTWVSDLLDFSVTWKQAWEKKI